MKLLMLSLAILLPFSTTATTIEKTDITQKRPTTSSKQIFFGERSPTNPCNSYARLLKVSEIIAIGQRNLCRAATSPYSIWKVAGEGGSEWSFMGTQYNCEIKAGVSPSAQALCVMKTTPPEAVAYLYPEIDFQGAGSWDGRADIKTWGEKNPNAEIKSFALGKNIQLTAYPEQDFAGDQKIFTKLSYSDTFSIKSYKIKISSKADYVTFSYRSTDSNTSCLTLKAAGSDIFPQTSCQNGNTGSQLFTIMPDKPMKDTVSLYFIQFGENTSEIKYGSFSLAYNGVGGFEIVDLNLPAGISANKAQNDINFKYTPQ